MANQYRSITAKGIESIFRVLIDADPRIERFRVGDYASAETMEDVYPMVILDFLGSRIERKATLHYKRWDIRLECYGMRRADGKNTTDVFAETDTILDDLVLRFVTEQDLLDMGFHFDARVSSNEYVIRNDRDDLIGVRTTITFNTPLMQCPEDFPVDALPDLGLYYSASTLTASSQYLTCLTLSGCSTIQSIQDDIAELYTLTGGTSTYVQDGVNTYTGGTASRPTVNVVASPVFTSVTASNFISGATNLSQLFSITGHTHLSVDITDGSTGGNGVDDAFKVVKYNQYGGLYALATGGTLDAAIKGELVSAGGSGFAVAGLSDNAIAGLFTTNSNVNPAAEISNTDPSEIGPILHLHNTNGLAVEVVNDGGLSWNSATGAETTRNNLGIPFVQPGTNITTGGTLSATTINVVPSPVFTSVSATSVSATTYFSGSTPLSTILSSLGGTPTRVQPGTNITTGGTPSAPVINVTSSPVFTSVSATTVSATTFVENGTALSARYAAISHTHTSSQISDATDVGRAILTASTASDQRTSLALGTAAVLNEVSVSDTSGQATSSTSYIDLTGISATMEANRLYAIELLVMAEVSNTSGSVNISLNGSTAASYVTMHYAGLQAAGNINVQNINAYDWTTNMPTGVASANSVYLSRISALILNGGSTSTLAGRIRRGGTTGTVTVRGAYMKVRRL